MKRFTDSIRLAVQAKNWYGALTGALSLPDVCGKLESPDVGSQQRYSAWFERWVQPKYTHQLGGRLGQQHIFLSGRDCYALRCSYLHEGGGQIEHQRAREALVSFHFITPPGNGSVIHMNQFNNTLQLQVDIFSNDIASAADQWSESVAGNEPIQARIKELIVIHDGANGVRF